MRQVLLTFPQFCRLFQIVQKWGKWKEKRKLCGKYIKQAISSAASVWKAAGCNIKIPSSWASLLVSSQQCGYSLLLLSSGKLLQSSRLPFEILWWSPNQVLTRFDPPSLFSRSAKMGQKHCRCSRTVQTTSSGSECIDTAPEGMLKLGTWEIGSVIKVLDHMGTCTIHEKFLCFHGSWKGKFLRKRDVLIDWSKSYVYVLSTPHLWLGHRATVKQTQEPILRWKTMLLCLCIGKKMILSMAAWDAP